MKRRPNLGKFARMLLDEKDRRDLHAEINSFGRRTAQRGRAYFDKGRVGPITGGNGFFEAVVRGTQRYSVEWAHGDLGWDCDCSCPVGIDCKHAYALALALLDGARTVDDAPVSHTSASPKPTGHTARRPESSIAERFRWAGDAWDRRTVLQDLIRGERFKHVSAYDPEAEQLLDEDDPEILCWALTEWIAERTGGDVPDALKVYLGRDDLAERRSTRERTQLAHDIVGWVGKIETPAERNLRFVWRLARSHSRWTLSVEGQLTSTRLLNDARTPKQLADMAERTRRDPSFLPRRQAHLLQTLVAEAVPTSFGHRSTSYTIDAAALPAAAVAMLKSCGGSSPEMRWANDLDERVVAITGIEPGGELRLVHDVVDVLPNVVAREESAELDLAIVTADGRAEPLSAGAYLPGSRTLQRVGIVIRAGSIFVVSNEPPTEIVERYLEVGSVPIPPETIAGQVALLVQRLPHIRASIAERVKTIRGVCLVAIDLRDDDWLQFRCFIHDGEPSWLPHSPVPPETTVLELSGSGAWRQHEEGVVAASYEAIEAPAAAEQPSVDSPTNQLPEWILEPDPVAAEEAQQWLTATGALPGTQGHPGGKRPPGELRDTGWWVPASAQRLQVLSALWSDRTPSIVFVGTPRVKRLLLGDDTARPKIDIRSSGMDWFSVSASWEAEGLALSERDMAKLQSSAERFVRLPSGWVRRDVVEEQAEVLDVLADVGLEVGAGEQSISVWQLVGADEASLQAFERMADGKQAVRAMKRLRKAVREFHGLASIDVPPTIKAELRPYQRAGLDFLAHAARMKMGSVLADDMGLGKTLQALALLQFLKDEKPRGGPALIVCPTSVMHNWAREAAQFAPNLRVLMLERGEERHQRRKQIRRHDLAITNYALLRRDIEEWQKIKLRAVVLDEAQNIKNPDANVTRAVLTLDAKHRVALTGTPLENRPLDLWSLSNFVNPGYLGSRANFSARFDRLDASRASRRLLSAKMRPIMLRRLKSEVARELPERIEERRDCELTAGQRKLYVAELRRSRRLVDELSDDDAALRKNKISILAALTRLRQICCHPALARGKASLGSGKFDALFELLEPLLAEGHKVLIFSQFVTCLNLLERALRKEGVKTYKLTGNTRNRGKVVEEFQSDPDPCAFLISLKAGGTGLNLTAASYVVIFDPWWNPAVEAQAIDRSHRIGQDRTVIAYRMIAKGTVEERIWDLQQQKAAMVRDVLGEDGFARSLNRDDLEYLLTEL